MKKHIKYLTMLPVIAVMLASCEDKVEYVPAEPDAPDCMGIYFDAENEQDFIFMPGAPAIATLKVHRQRADAAVDVPLIVNTTCQAIAVPASVHFDAGQSTAEFDVDFSAMPLKQLERLTIGFEDKYINHYAATLFNYETSAIVSSWEPANKDGSPVKFYFVSIDYNYYSDPKPESVCYQPVESEMEVLPGVGRIRVNNFLNSGENVIFSLTPSPYADFEGYYRVMPETNHYSMAEAYESDDYGDPWYNAWFLMDSTEDEDYVDLPLSNLNGNPSTLSYPYFMCYSESYSFEYSYMVPKSSTRSINSITMGLGGNPAEDGLTIPQHFYLYFGWDGETGL